MDTLIKTVNLDSRLGSHDLSLGGKKKYKKIKAQNVRGMMKPLVHNLHLGDAFKSTRKIV